MRRRLAKLEKLSRKLEPTKGERKAARKKVLKYTEKFLNEIENIKAFQFKSNKGIGLLQSPIREKPTRMETLLKLIKENVDYPSLNPASGGHFGYIPGGGIYYSALGDYLADITNRYAGVFYAGPGAVRMENMLIKWVAGLMGFPLNSAGNLTSGGSIANLISICTARDAKKVNSQNVQKSVIYLSSQAHHSLEKAIRIAGLRECILRYVSLDNRYRIDPDQLARHVTSDKREGLLPFLVIASAGTTDAGAIDPLDKIASIAKQHKLWFHIDAAYGGFFMMTREGRKKLKGIEKGDSLVVDPHKGLFLPYGIGVVLIKDSKRLSATHYYQANYMQDALSANDETSPANVSPELSKHFRGLRMWLPMKLHGVSPFRSCLEEKLLLAKYFYKEVRKLGFETGQAPELSIVTYRYVPEEGDADAFNKKLVEIVQKDGRVYISSTLLGGKFMLRFACLNFRTHVKQVDILLKILEDSI